jgi:hypothetical protein
MEKIRVNIHSVAWLVVLKSILHFVQSIKKRCTGDN